MTPLETYLAEVRDIRHSGAGVRETSYYGPLARLLDEAGGRLRPKVRCIMQLRDVGGGIPDGGFFTADQFPRTSAGEPLEGQLPARGALEVKGLEDDAFQVAEGEQVARYVERYGQVLVTNLRDFVLVGTDGAGRVRALESFRIAPSYSAFLTAIAQPRRTATEVEAPLMDYLRRVMLRPAPLSDPKDVAWFLASYAREARARVEAAGAVPTLEGLRRSIEGALGVRFEGERGDHFFRSTLVQTLFYGVFSAWVLWNRRAGAGRFDWRTASWELRVPMIRALFHQVTNPDRLYRLDLVQVLDWTAEVLNRVNRTEFFARFREEHAVQYFYEPFLEAFDPELRRQLGVWYTPPEVVRYMVAKVDHLLRTELGLADGLADPRVVVLDPCCGTGAYLVEVLHRIEETLRARGDDALLAADLKRAATQRIFGFEIMPAPFVVAHLQLGLLLQQKGAALGEAERAGVYLTNALTGWVPPKDPKDQIPIALPELASEREAAAHVKRDQPILVILGNPPYSGYAGLAIGEERDLVDAYRTTRRAPRPQGQGLNDLYVRFFRMAERKIVEMEPHHGIVCFISNYSWLDGLSFTGMRERYLEVFDQIWIDNLNGDRYRTGKLTPEGEPDPSIFSTKYNREGIQVGTAVATLVRRERHVEGEEVYYRDLWGRTKLDQLAEDAERVAALEYERLRLEVGIGLPLRPKMVAGDYLTWPKLPELFPSYYPGVQTKRDELVIDIDRDKLVARMKAYFDPSITHEEMAGISERAMEKTAAFNARATREYLQKRGFLPEYIVHHLYRPFDMRYVYWEPETNLLERKVPDYFAQVTGRTPWIIVSQRNRRGFQPPGCVTALGSLHVIEWSASYFPMQVSEQNLFSMESDGCTPVGRYNISKLAVHFLRTLGAPANLAPHLFHHAVAVMHAPAYREENAGALRQDWPRIPLPDDVTLLESSAELGRELAALLDPEVEVSGVTQGEIRRELRAISPVTRAEGGQLDPESEDLALTAGWGYAGSRGVTMPGRGRAERRTYTEEERAAIVEGAGERALELLGEECYDVWLNDIAYWKCIPSRVWEYTLGGYQVIKKWLSYRERPLLGRPLRPEEVRELTEIARRIAAILLLEPALDENYTAVKEAVWTTEVPAT